MALNDRVVIDEIKVENNSSAGFSIPPSPDEEKPIKGIVVSVWPLVEEEQNIKVGDVVHFTKYAPDEIEVEGKKYLSVVSKALLCKEQNND